MANQKFILFDTSQVKLGDRLEERYHYESEDKQTRIIFNAGEEPWTWEIIGNASRPLALKLIDKFIENVSDNDETIKELEV